MDPDWSWTDSVQVYTNLALQAGTQEVVFKTFGKPTQCLISNRALGPFCGLNIALGLKVYTTT